MYIVNTYSDYGHDFGSSVTEEEDRWIIPISNKNSHSNKKKVGALLKQAYVFQPGERLSCFSLLWNKTQNEKILGWLYLIVIIVKMYGVRPAHYAYY